MRIAQGPDNTRGAEALLSARGARREALLSASGRLCQPRNYQDMNASVYYVGT